MPLSKFSLEKTVFSDIDSVFEIFSNYENYQSLVPQHFSSVRVRSVRGSVAVVEEHINFGNEELVIMAKHVSKSPISHKVFVIGGDIKGSYFKQQFVGVPEGTKVLVDAEIKVGRLELKEKLFGSGRHAKHYDRIIDDFVKLCKKD